MDGKSAVALVSSSTPGVNGETQAALHWVQNLVRADASSFSSRSGLRRSLIHRGKYWRGGMYLLEAR